VTGLIKTAKLWAKTSEKSGRSYLTGRWGGCRVLVFENDKTGDGEPTHWLMLGDAEQGQQPGRLPAPAQRRAWSGPAAGDSAAEFFHEDNARVPAREGGR
jgi:hypothetical protein